MVQVAKSIESSTKEQEKNRDERLKILLEAERKRDELFYVHQREQADANRRHEMLLAQLLTRDHQLHINHRSKIIFRWPTLSILL
jgi:hypothetical protein